MAKARRSSPVVCGVYFLFRAGNLTYVGQSQDCYGRIETHRRNGREFDFATVMPLQAEMLSQVEAALIKAYRPVKNVVHMPMVIRPRLPDLSELAPLPPRHPKPEPSGLGTITVAAARRMALHFGIGMAAIDEGMAAGDLRFVDSDRISRAGSPVRVARYAAVETYCIDRQKAKLREMGLADEEQPRISA